MKEEYAYQFHPSILCTNRQIEREASHVLYAENLLVRVSSCGRSLSAGTFGACGGGHAVPILAEGHHAERFSRHVMEFIMLRDYAASSSSENCFVIAREDLPRFCWALLVKNLEWDEPLSRLTFAIEVRHYVDVPAAQGEAAAKSQNKVEGQACVDDAVGVEENAATDATDVIIPNDSVQKGTKCTEHQTRRLLEPFRRLHSVQAVHIEGPISGQYKASLLASMCGPGPSDQELFDAASAKLEDAMLTYDAGDVSSAVTKLKYTLDAIDEYRKITPKENSHLSALWDAYDKMNFTIWAKLSEASLKDRKNYEAVMEAEYYIEKIICNCLDEDGLYWNAPPMGHEVAMVFYMWADVWEALDDLTNQFENDECRRRSDCLADVVDYLSQGRGHEPGNKLLEEQLERRLEELASVRQVEALMEMFDRINETDGFKPDVYLSFDEDDEIVEAEG